MPNESIAHDRPYEATICFVFEVNPSGTIDLDSIALEVVKRGLDCFENISSVRL